APGPDGRGIAEVACRGPRAPVARGADGPQGATGRGAVRRRSARGARPPDPHWARTGTHLQGVGADRASEGRTGIAYGRPGGPRRRSSFCETGGSRREEQRGQRPAPTPRPRRRPSRLAGRGALPTTN